VTTQEQVNNNSFAGLRMEPYPCEDCDLVSPAQPPEPKSMNSQILQNRNAIIYGAGGSLGSTIAKAMAQEGAKVFLAGRHLSSVKEVADGIVDSGGRAVAARVDAMDESEVNAFVDSVIGEGGTLDLSFCAIDYQVLQNVPLVRLSVEDFVRPVSIAMRSHFLTATAAGNVMLKQGSGVILSLTATPGGIGYPFTAGFAPACAAIESFSRNLALELGTHGVRVVNIRSGGSPDSQVFKQAIERTPKEMEVILRGMENDTMLKRLPLMDEIANAAVFLASDFAKSITGVTIDVTGGTTAGLNYRVASSADHGAGPGSL
jgi:NAD(P)-dependent dehydrogenase (short-subunit alcohol dehydrogenase family)